MAVTVCILGSTGSIGKQTLDVIRQHRRQFSVVALTCYANDDALFSQCQEFHPQCAVCSDPAAAKRLRIRLKEAGIATQVLAGALALAEVARDSASNTVVAAIVGAAGLRATFAAIQAGKKVLLANKEALVMSGNLLMDAVKKHQATLLPVDSEHNALFQCMPKDFIPGDAKPPSVAGIILTASGGPFLHYPQDDFAKITPQQAIAHPNWSMGAKISVDSATMMNKGLEVIEAHWLFALTANEIEVVIHPQSVIHSLLRYVDGSVLAQCGVPDMRTPIAYCLAWPQRIRIDVKRLNLIELARFDFIAPDPVRFPCLNYAFQALEAGPVACIVLNVANEMAVDAFLKGNISYVQIPEVVEHYLSHCVFDTPRCIDDVIEIEKQVRAMEVFKIILG